MTPRTSDTAFDAVIVGGGVYGVRVALLLRGRGARVLLVERDPVLLQRASLVNQARVHNGYHYPRSILTSLRSRVNYARFIGEYAECIEDCFPHYYAVARPMSKITASQFAEFCRRIGAPVQPAPRDVAALFDPHRVAMVFDVRECAFDAARLRERLARDLAAAGVVVVLGTEAEVVRPDGKGGSTGVVVALRKDADGWEVRTPLVINATYSRLNHLLERSGGARIALKHELTEMALVAPPPALGGAAVTVMDGPFFSLMPYPSRGLYTLSHVRYTPHCSWLEGEAPARDGDAMLQARPASRAVHMLRDAERYLPCMRDARYVESIWEVKTILPRSEVDDSRPILFRQDPHLPAVYSVLGAKIDSVYDVEAAMAATFGFAAAAGR